MRRSTLDSDSMQWYVELYARGAAKLATGAVSPDSIMIDASSNTLTYTGVGVRGELQPHPPIVLRTGCLSTDSVRKKRCGVSAPVP